MPLSQEILRDKFKGAILGCFLGDAFGSGFEGMDPDRARFHIGNLSKTLTRSYTDDTDMTLALAEIPHSVRESRSRGCCKAVQRLL